MLKVGALTPPGWGLEGGSSCVLPVHPAGMLKVGALTPPGWGVEGGVVRACLWLLRLLDSARVGALKPSGWVWG
eukprot:359460-Chlamydomonas_euryale.AAC.1